jgi:hypothetical protein
VGDPTRAGTGPARFAARCLLVLALASSAAAQGGWVTEKYPDLGLTFPRARNYEQIPTPPDEDHVVLYFAEKVPEKSRERKEIRPELNVVWIEKCPEDRRPTDTLARFVEHSYPKWKLGGAVEGKTRNGYVGAEYSLAPFAGARDPRTGWVYAYQGEKRTIAFLGFCQEKDLKDQVKIWRYAAERVEFAEPEVPSTGELERSYARLALPNPEYRIAVRQKLVRGWKAEDTEHYIVVYDTTDQPLVRKIVRDLELIHGEYEKLFPSASDSTPVSTVRVCKSAEEYVSYGGDPHTAGYWNADAEELVLYDAEKVERHVKSDADTFVVLYHEAFHQYIHYSCGELPPHSWFNEGHGDYFSGASIKDGRTRSIGPNPWRVETVKAMVDFGKTIPWKEILRYEQPEYYADDKVGLCYAQGWAMVYFLRKSKAVEQRPEWARILPTYFGTLQRTYRESLADLEKTGRKDDVASRAKAGLAAREKALQAAFEGVDVAEIDAAWIEFVRGLEVPKGG